MTKGRFTEERMVANLREADRTTIAEAGGSAMGATRSATIARSVSTCRALVSRANYTKVELRGSESL